MVGEAEVSAEQAVAVVGRLAEAAEALVFEGQVSVVAEEVEWFALVILTFAFAGPQPSGSGRRRPSVRHVVGPAPELVAPALIVVGCVDVVGDSASGG